MDAQANEPIQSPTAESDAPDRRDGVPAWRFATYLVLAGLALLAVFLPELLSSANRKNVGTPCMANLRKIGQGMHLYAGNDGRFPAEMQALINSGECDAALFKCPNVEVVGDDVNSCYVYIPRQTTRSDPRNVLVYEKQGHHPNDVAYALFVDGHAESIKGYENVLKLVRETEGRLGAAQSKTSSSVNGIP